MKIASEYWAGRLSNNMTQDVVVSTDTDTGEVYLNGFFGCTKDYSDKDTAIADTARRHGFEVISCTDRTI
tara:strand:- start:1176 stop:1385 length:210 start_codon:yes stop_codon:yes gene_type:complete